MKKRLSVLFILTFFAGFLFAQDTLPNCNFENWTSYDGGQYFQPTGGPDSVWTTANKIVLLGMPVTTTQTSDAESGSSAAKITTQTYVGMVLSGTLATGFFNSSLLPPNNLKLGKPFIGRPVSFSGYYKYVHNQGDSCAIYATLSKWTGSARETIGRAKLMNPTDSVTSYTQFNLTFDYYLPDIPDTISVVFASSAGGGSLKGHVGSTLYVDNINISYTNGFNEISKPAIKVQCYPVPANTTVNFVLERNTNKGSIKIFNELGRELKAVNVTNKEFSIPVNDLSKGKYYYQIIEINNILNSGYFLVN